MGGTVFRMTTAGVYSLVAEFPANRSLGVDPRPGLVEASPGVFFGTCDRGGASGLGTVFKVTTTGGLTLVHEFNATDGRAPGQLVLGSDGVLYGTAIVGQYNGCLFSITTSGTFTKIADFPSGYGVGDCGLTEGNDGNFYVMAFYISDPSRVVPKNRSLRISKAGVFTPLAEVGWGFGNNRLTLGNDGDFYGVATEGGPDRMGTVYKMTTDGYPITLATFNRASGFGPCGRLALGADGNFYGATRHGGADEGTVFRVTPAGELTTLAYFINRANGTAPYGGVTLDSAGHAWGTTITGGTYDRGTVFRLDVGAAAAPSPLNVQPEVPAALEFVSHPAAQTVFEGATVQLSVKTRGGNGARSYIWRKNGAGMSDGGKVQGANTPVLKLTNVTPADQASYSVVVTDLDSQITSNAALLRVRLIDADEDGVRDIHDQYPDTAPGAVVNAQGGSLEQIAALGGYLSGEAVTPTVIHHFPAISNPGHGLVRGPDGSFYGASPEGARMSDGTYRIGSVFKVAPNGTVTTLASMTHATGYYPTSRLVLASDGNLWGVAAHGGLHGLGTIYKVATTGAGGIIPVFHFNGANGAQPYQFVQGGDGALYGLTSFQGGSQPNTNENWGAFFKITTAGVYSLLTTIPASLGSPINGLAQGPDGAFYGGTGRMPNVTQPTTGELVRIASDGSTFTVKVLALLPGMIGPNPLTTGPDGRLYGLTERGGTMNFGAAFRAQISLDGTSATVTTLASFTVTNGMLPLGGLTLGGDGLFYGTTSKGGAFEGTVFQMTPAGAVTTLAHFTDRDSTGTGPAGALVIDDDGRLWGTACGGGAHDGGVIFRVDPAAPSISAVMNLKLQPQSQTIDTGKPVTFTAAATRGNDGVKTWLWRKNGKALVNSKQVSGVRTPTLTLANVRKADAGAYDVVVVSKKGRSVQRAISEQAILTVNVVDTDGDGVSDDADKYPGTAPGDAVNKAGASIAQLVPESGPRPGVAWKNHAAYVAAVTRTANTFRLAKLISATQSRDIVRAALNSSAGSPPAASLTVTAQ